MDHQVAVGRICGKRENVREKRGRHGWEKSHGGIMRLYCPTRQLEFEKSVILRNHPQVVDSADAGYCAWGCFGILVGKARLTPRK
jgi:hypothetical protein